MQSTGISNGLKIWSLTQCEVQCQLATTNMHSGESHIGGENDNNSMDLLLIGNLLKMSTPNAESMLDDDKLYKLKERDFNRLRIQDIEDMLLLLVQGKLTNLTVEERLDFNVSFLVKKNRLMRIDELHKFSDGTLNDVRTALDDRLKGIRMKYLPQTIWRQSDRDKARAMIQTIDKQLKTKRIMRSLETFDGGRPYDGDFRLLQRAVTKHAEFDESDTHVLERFDTSAGNPVKEILLKLNLPDHMSIDLPTLGNTLNQLKQEEQDISQYWKPPVYYPDDDDDFYIESIDETPPSDAITPD
ncbi:hypothetical protein Tco_0600596 [Tanacetum coccineum]